MELDLLSFVLGCALGGWVGYRVGDHLHKRIMPDLFRRAGVTPEKLEQVMQELRRELEIPEPVTQLPEVNIVVESVNGRLYVYRKETSEFLAQGVNYDEILAALRLKFSEVRIAVTKEDGADLLKVNPTS